MARSFLSSVSLMSLALLSLSACQTAPVTPEATAAVPPIVDESPYHGLEKRVEMLEGQMRTAQPTLKKVEVMESHFKALSFELDKIAADYHVNDAPTSVAAPVPAVVAQEPEPLKPDVKKEIPKPVVQAEPAHNVKADVKPIAPTVFAVTSVRVGEQTKNMTRIVLDTTKPAEIHYDLDNTEGLLVIDIPKAKWATTESQTFAKSPMVKSFKAMSDDAGAHFVTDLKQKAKVVATARLAPSGTSGNRVYIDIAPAK
jgi:hypothetical protein